MNNIRVRFAPSPTGFLHIGGARTALFNWLFARHHNGTFILRIEDTDEIRSTPESVEAILQSLLWLGIDWDEGPEINSTIYRPPSAASKSSYGPYFQMQRLEIYKKYAEQLVSEGKAYHCYCSPEELNAMREQQRLKKLPPKYDGRCREKSRKIKSERQAAIRFKMPQEGIVKFNDIIRGELEFENELLDDFVLLKASGVPTYNFACTIDDKLMEITHVIRGDDHISNTPRQIHLYNAFGWELPKFAHLSMILGPDGRRLSKRHGHTSVLEYRDNGYLADAVFNYLALLGWSTTDSQQLFRKEELIEKFSLERCSKSPAIFDMKKLQWLNMEYLKKLSPLQIFDMSKQYIINAGLPTENKEFITKIIEIEKEKIKLLTDVPDLIDFFLIKNVKYDKDAVDKILKDPDVFELLAKIKIILTTTEIWTKENLEKIVREFCQSNKLKTSRVFHPIRVAVSGRMEGPGLFDTLELLGKEKVISRITKFTKLDSKMIR